MRIPFFKKGKSRDEIIAEAAEVKEEPVVKEDSEIKTGNAKLDLELTKIKSQIDALNEVRKANAERFNRLSEQIGELRGMITDISKTVSKVEVGATKAIDLVESVHPEKLMIEVRKTDNKIEALRAQLDGYEARLNDLMSELKKMREQMSVYQGLEQVAQLNDEMKDELAEMRKMQVLIQKHASKVESIFVEVNKKFVEFDKFNDVVKDLKRQFDAIQEDMNKLKVAVDNKSDKKEFLKLVERFSSFEKHTDNVLSLIEKRSKEFKQELLEQFNKVKKELEEYYSINPDANPTKREEALATKGLLSGILEGVKVLPQKRKEEASEKKIITKSLEEGASEEENTGNQAGTEENNP